MNDTTRQLIVAIEGLRASIDGVRAEVSALRRQIAVAQEKQEGSTKALADAVSYAGHRITPPKGSWGNPR